MITSTPFYALRALKSLVPAAAFAALLVATTAQSQVTITETQLNALSPTGVPITGNPPDTFLTYQTTIGAQTITLTNGATVANGKYMQRRNQQGTVLGNNFAGDFPDATPLLRNVVSSSASNSADGVLITFSSGVSAFGFNFDPTLPFAPTNFSFQVSEGLTQTNFDQTGIINFAQGDGSAPFFGVQDAGGNRITSILIVGSAVAGMLPPGLQTNTTPNDFAVGLLRFNVITPVPEPGSMALLAGMVVTGVRCLSRRKRAAINK